VTDEQLLQMAETAFDVLNWARREGMKKDQQLEQVVSGFKADLAQFNRQLRRQCDEDNKLPKDCP